MRLDGNSKAKAKCSEFRVHRTFWVLGEEIVQKELCVMSARRIGSIPPVRKKI